MATIGGMSYVYEMDKYFDPEGSNYDGLSDDGVAFDAILRSKSFDFGKAANRKRFTRLYLTLYSDMLSFDIDVDVNMDNEEQAITDRVVSNNASRWGNDDPADDATETGFQFGDVINAERTNLNFPIKLVHRGKRYTFQYVLSSNGLNQAWLLKDVTLMMKVKELK
jgi:hypothetical protein